MTNYPIEILDEYDDNGTMPESLAALAEGVVGHRIVSAETRTVNNSDWYSNRTGLLLTLDDGRTVSLVGGGDCCAYTEIESFLLDPSKVDHVITGVGTTDGFTQWHIYADMGDVLALTVGWSCGNPFYYGYGFTITVTDAPKED